MKGNCGKISFTSEEAIPFLFIATRKMKKMKKMKKTRWVEGINWGGGEGGRGGVKECHLHKLELSIFFSSQSGIFGYNPFHTHLIEFSVPKQFHAIDKGSGVTFLF